ncbi:CLUMA_CG019148, isoform A [Clunio marinus]|uniref:CLUMA_CG019148, isoform A n=1 Tax=Clunio marinus TaxID=568069 RepID=A0A1J1J218_9DIPT|nr:CLUMA_CG019148, isoform A [Clunio marinus]
MISELVWQKITIDEFDMLRDGDKVLICISGSSSSICLLHLLRQFTRVRGLHVEFGAVTIGESVGLDPRALMLYLRDLGIDFIFEASDPAVSLKTRLSTIARRKGFNVVALGNTLDKLADDVLKRSQSHQTTHFYSRKNPRRLFNSKESSIATFKDLLTNA